MGTCCFSKPLLSVRPKSSVAVHPQAPDQQNSVGNGQTPIQLQEPPKSLVHGQHIPPPKDEPVRAIKPIPIKTFLTPKPAPERLTIISPSSSVNASTMNVSSVSTPRTPAQIFARRVSEFFHTKTSPTALDDAEKPREKRRPELHRNSTKLSLIRRKSKVTSGKRSSNPRPNSPSLNSDSNSVLALNDGLTGLYALASLTAYETNLIPLIWRSCLDQNAYYCEHVLSRLFNRHPELEDMLKNTLSTNENQCPVAGSTWKTSRTSIADDASVIMSEKSEQVYAFFNRVIMNHGLDYDRLSEECDRLGRSHAMYYYDRGLQPYHWDAFAVSVVQEYRKTNMNVDLNTDEKELQQLAWTHFTTAVISAVKEAFEDELRQLTPGSSTHLDTSSTIDKNIFKF